MKKNTVFLFLSIFTVLLSGCNKRVNTSMMKNVTGKPGELLVVISPDLWDAEPGDELKSLLLQPQYGLPQDEPIFTVISIPYEGYGDIFKTSRNIIEIKINANAETKIDYKKDTHAYLQALVQISAKNKAELLDVINANADKLVGFFLKAEKNRLMHNYSKYNEKEVRLKAEEQFGVTLNVPPGFHVYEQKDSFMWMQCFAPEITQGIFIYSYPYEDDSTFTVDYLVAKRNIFTKHNVPGPTDGSYMTTEIQLPVMFNVFKKDGNYAAEIRGLWKVENDFMGGPFVSISMLDILKKRVVTVEGYVYGPNTDKRNYLRQVEAMIYSTTFVNQEDMNKLNKQFD